MKSDGADLSAEWFDSVRALGCSLLRNDVSFSQRPKRPLG